jgi:hypothetical protein
MDDRFGPEDSMDARADRSRWARSAHWALALALAAGATTTALRIARAAEPEVLSLPRPAGGEWMGIYLLGHKAGYSFSRVWADHLDGKPVVRALEDTTLRAKVGDRTVTRRLREERTYESRPGGHLIRFASIHEGDGGNETLEARSDALGMHLVRKREGLAPEKLDLPPTEDVVENADLGRLAAAAHKSFSGKVFDSTELRDKRERADYLGPGILEGGGAQVKVLRVAVTEEDGTVAAEISIRPSDGTVLQLKFGGALLGVPEPESLAKQLGTVDLFALTRVDVDRPLPVGRVPATIRYLVRGLPGGLRPAPERQSYRDLPGGEVEVTVRAALPTKQQPRPAASPAEFLKATADVESDAPAIRALAKEIVGNEHDSFKASTRITRWVFENVRSAYGVSLDHATDVLRQKAGDCTEHALLATALARASGIPARLIHGLVYSQGSDGKPGLFWHEWVEVWTGQWVAIDPTFGQPVADATHIQLGEGDQTDAVALMGQLKIHVAEVL